MHLLDEESILELESGDRLFVCNGLSYLDSDEPFEFEMTPHETAYIYENGDGIIVRNNRIMFIRKGKQKLIADPEDDRCMWFYRD